MNRSPFEEFNEERRAMVAQQIEGRGIKNARVLEAMRRVPRHVLAPGNRGAEAYEDHPISIGGGQTISQPYMVGLMTDLLDVKPDDRILEIGTGSGYQAAVLGELAAQVDTIERLPSLADAARESLEALGYQNINVIVGDGTLGNPAGAPYDGILVTAGAPVVPEDLQQQLADGGRLVCPVGSAHMQQLVKIIREGSRYRRETSIDCVFVPLIGERGWEK